MVYGLKYGVRVLGIKVNDVGFRMLCVTVCRVHKLRFTTQDCMCV